MNKTTLTLIVACVSAVIMLSGCAKAIDNLVIAKAMELCENNGGIDWIFAEVGAPAKISCKNGAYFNLKD